MTSRIATRMCDSCGQPIPPQRVKALPETTCCVECSSERSKTVYDVELDGPDNTDMVSAVRDIPSGQ